MGNAQLSAHTAPNDAAVTWGPRSRNGGVRMDLK